MHPLTDAFVKGRLAHKKATDSYFEVKGKKVTSCAVGAIYYGLFGKIPDNMSMIPLMIGAQYSQTREDAFTPPCLHDTSGSLIGILLHLNDTPEHQKEWTDKKIQEWMDKTLVEYDAKQNMPPV